MAWILYFMPIYYIIFITQKSATAKNRFQILILHPKKNIIEEKTTLFLNVLLLDQYRNLH